MSTPRDHGEYVQGLNRRIATLNAANAELTRTLESYRLLVPRLIGQAENAHREAQGLKPKPAGCPSVSMSGKLCDLLARHDGWHVHDGDGGRHAWAGHG